MRLAGAIWIGLIVGLLACWLAWTALAQEHRITELECALAQAQALLAEESLDTGNLGLDMP